MASRIRISITVTDNDNSNIVSNSSKLFHSKEFIPASEIFEAYEQLITDVFHEYDETGQFPKFDLDNPKDSEGN